MRVCGMRHAYAGILQHSHRFFLAMRPFGYGPHSSRITFRREYARILTHKVFKIAAYGNYGRRCTACEVRGMVSECCALQRVQHEEQMVNFPHGEAKHVQAVCVCAATSSGDDY
jgi:hypothetical protein